MSKKRQIQDLARIVIADHIAALEFLNVAETAYDEELDLTEDELSEAHSLAIRAKAVLPND